MSGTHGGIPSQLGAQAAPAHGALAELNPFVSDLFYSTNCTTLLWIKPPPLRKSGKRGTILFKSENQKVKTGFYFFQKIRRASRGVLFFSENVWRGSIFTKKSLYFLRFCNVKSKIVVKIPQFFSPRFARHLLSCDIAFSISSRARSVADGNMRINCGRPYSWMCKTFCKKKDS